MARNTTTLAGLFPKSTRRQRTYKQFEGHAISCSPSDEHAGFWDYACECGEWSMTISQRGEAAEGRHESHARKAIQDIAEHRATLHDRRKGWIRIACACGWERKARGRDAAEQVAAEHAASAS